MTYDEMHQTTELYVSASLLMLNLKPSRFNTDKFAHELLDMYGDPPAIMSACDSEYIYTRVGQQWREDRITAEEIREDLAMSTRQISLPLHPEDIAECKRRHPAGKGRESAADKFRKRADELLARMTPEGNGDSPVN